MCGRFTITLEPADFEDELGVSDFPPDFEKRYNVAPTQQVAVVRDAGTRQVEWMKWGLIPSWATDPTIGSRMINARSETLAEKPSFKQAFAKRRCLILGDGFFEWQKHAGSASTPFYLKLSSGKPFAFAGLWERWHPSEEVDVVSCTIITCPPNELIAPIHDRMPVILDKNSLWQWLQPAPFEELEKQLRPYPSGLMQAFQIGRSINNAAFDAQSVINPA